MSLPLAGKRQIHRGTMSRGPCLLWESKGAKKEGAHRVNSPRSHCAGCIRGCGVRGHALHRRPRCAAPLLASHPRADRIGVRGGPRVRRLVGERIPDHRRVGHASHPRSRHRDLRPVHQAQDLGSAVRCEGSRHRRDVRQGPPRRGAPIPVLPGQHRHCRQCVLRARGRVLHLRQRGLPEPARRGPAIRSARPRASSRAVARR